MKKYIRFIAVFATLVLGFSIYKKEDSSFKGTRIKQ